MNTKPIPAVIMLLSGMIVSVMGYVTHMGLESFLRLLLLVMIGFYVIGGVIKMILDKNFSKIESEEILEQITEEDNTHQVGNIEQSVNESGTDEEKEEE